MLLLLFIVNSLLNAAAAPLSLGLARRCFQVALIVVVYLIVRVYASRPLRPLASQPTPLDETGRVVANLLDHLDLLLAVDLPIVHVVARCLLL